MKKIIRLAVLAMLGLLGSVVLQAQVVRGEGRYVENKLTHLMPFEAIDVRADAQVDIWQRADTSVRVSGKSNLVALADIRVEEKTLIIDFKRPAHIKGSHALHVTIGLPELTAVSVRKEGRVRVRGAFDTAGLTLTVNDKAYLTGDSIRTDTLRVQALNQAEVDLERIQVKELDVAAFDKAEVELSGAAQTGRLVNNSSKDMEADGLRINQAKVTVNGKGDVEVFAMHSLQAQANGSGKIEYHGQPTLTHSGNIKKIRPAIED